MQWASERLLNRNPAPLRSTGNSGRRKRVLLMCFTGQDLEPSPALLLLTLTFILLNAHTKLRALRAKTLSILFMVVAPTPRGKQG
jgi:hypothetical protein